MGIEQSKISIVVLSPDYAGSSWCLDELVHTMDCRKSYGRFVFPVFYGVDPSHVRNQTGDFGKALELTATKKEDQLLSKWKTALTEVSIIVGWDYNTIR